VHVQAVLDALERLGCRPRAAGPGRWMALCPAHDDHSPSLSITEGPGGRAHLHCFAGCPPEAIWERLALPMPEPSARRDGGRPQEAQGPVRGELGPLEARRLVEETGISWEEARALGLEHDATLQALAFTWASTRARKLRLRRGGEPKWAWVDHDGERKPSLWPEVTAETLGGSQTAVICEGERDALALRAIGLPAYSVTHGAGTPPRQEDIARLLALGVRRFLLAFDADQAGADGERKARSAIYEAARRWRLRVTVESLPLPLEAVAHGAKDWTEARQALGEGLREAVKGLPESAKSVPSSIETELGGTDIKAWQALPLGEAPEGEAVSWVWEGFLARGLTTDLYGLWKVGKSTLLGCLLREMATGGELAGRPVAQGRALIVTEESAAKWKRRAEKLGIPHGFHDIIARPFKKRATWEEWERLVSHLAHLVAERGYSLVVLDALPNLWPVVKENEAGEVLQALRPLVAVTEAGAAVLMVRHPRKSDGEEATAGRGSGAIDGFVDVIVEFRRYRPEEREDTRRVFSVYSREEPFELVADFDGTTYIALGSKKDVRQEERFAALLSVLPSQPPGLTYGEVREAWPTEPRPGLATIKADLARLLKEGRVAREGEGVSGRPFRWWAPKSVPPSPPLIGDGTGSPAQGPAPEGPALMSVPLSSTSIGGGTDFPADGPQASTDAPSPRPPEPNFTSDGHTYSRNSTPALPAWAREALEELGAPPPEPPTTARFPDDAIHRAFQEAGAGHLLEEEEGPPHPVSRSCPACEPAPWPWFDRGYQACPRGPTLIRHITRPQEHLLCRVPGHKGGPWVAISEELLKATHPRWLIVRIMRYGDGWVNVEANPGARVDYREPQRAWRLDESRWEVRQGEFPGTPGRSALEFPDIKTPDAETPDIKTPDAETPDTQNPGQAKTPDAKTPDAQNSGRLETPDTENPGRAETPDTQTPDTETPDIKNSGHLKTSDAKTPDTGNPAQNLGQGKTPDTKTPGKTPDTGQKPRTPPPAPENLGRCPVCGKPLSRPRRGPPPRWCSDACRKRAARKGRRP